MNAIRIILRIVALLLIGVAGFLNDYVGVIVWFALSLGYVIGAIDNE